MAGPLRIIGTPTAIEALVEDLPKGSDNQTDFALEKLGSKAIPFLMPLFDDEGSSQAAARVIAAMGDSAIPFVQSWSQIANDPDEPLKKRLAALRAISAFGAISQIRRGIATVIIFLSGIRGPCASGSNARVGSEL